MSTLQPDPVGIQPYSLDIDLRATVSVDRKRWTEIGQSLIAKSRVAVVMFAGGQGSRLGTNSPKGCFELLPNESLFYLHAKSLRQAQGEPGTIWWYIMTSASTHEATTLYFHKHHFFGLARDQVFFFQQGSRACLSLAGEVLQKPGGAEGPVMAPDGNGGVFRALRDTGCLRRMREAGVQVVQLTGVDNVLTKMADPTFFGLLSSSKVSFVNKVILKTQPHESVGVMALRGDQPVVVEYSELTLAQKNMRGTSTGDLLFGLANIAQHFVTLGFLTQQHDDLPWHVARKKIAHAGDQHPSGVNGVKMEQFVFDAIPKDSLCALVPRSSEFAPLKNRFGNDSVHTARRSYVEQQ